MTSSNVYAKNYSSRRSVAETENYKLILFPADNSIAVVKEKQCSPAEHDGFLIIQSGKKRFSGVALEEGSLQQCSKAADRMTKKHVNPDIESDYERADENLSIASLGRKTTSTISTLTTIPFANHSTNAPSFPTHVPTQSDQSKELIRSDNSIGSLSSKTNERENEKRTNASPSSSSIVNSSSNDGTSNQSTKRCSKQHKESNRKRKKQADKDKTTTASFDDLEDQNSSDDDHQQTLLRDNQSSNNDTPTFAGQRVVASASQLPNHSNISSMFQRLLASTSKIESQYLRPLLVAHERTETLAKCLFENQKKIQKVLRKQKINICLSGLDESLDDATDHTFLNSLEYKMFDGTTVDLLKRTAVKEHANRYVTSLMDVLYQHEELLAMKTIDVPKDERYLLIKEAVKNKFRLNQDELETMWTWLHTVFLAKRRTLNAKKKRQGIIMSMD